MEDNLKKLLIEKHKKNQLITDISVHIISLFINKINTFLNEDILIDIGNIPSWNYASTVNFESTFDPYNYKVW